MKSIKFFVFAAALFFSVSMFAQTPSCSNSAAAVSAMWDKFGQWDPGIQVGPYNVKVATAISQWNAMAANSWATMGPRSLKFKATERGTLMGQTNRTFITAPSYKKSVRVTIKKTGGKAKTGVTICSTDKRGRKRILAQYTFPNGKGKANKSFLLPNVAGKVISVNMRNYSVGNKFKYTITAR